MASVVDWTVAERVAVRLANRDTPRGYDPRAMQSEFEELTAIAQEKVEAHTGWRSTEGAARAKVVDRGDWARANIASFQRMLRPLTERLESGPDLNLVNQVGSRIAGAEMGAMLGWMSSRVLGQYDLLVLEEENVDDQDLVYYVGPNIVGLENKFDFPPQEFRLWVALHEVTHRTQFTGKPWLREYFLAQVDELLTMVDPDPARLFAAIGRVAEAIRTRSNPLADGGLPVLFASEEQRATMDRVGGLMSLLEGHGDVTMDRAGGDQVPSAERFGDVLRQRRSSGSTPTKLVQRLIGLEAKMAQYQQGEDFIAAVEESGGSSMLEVAFDGPETLPTLAEIREPDRWIERISSSGALVAN